MHTIFITGAAGYVGGMLVRTFAEKKEVVKIIGLDKEPLPGFLKDVSKLHYVQMNTAEAWEAEVARFAPDIVIHTAWHIREIYGDRKTTWKWNIEGSDKVFDFCCSQVFVKRLIHFSTVASYGAFSDNTIEHQFKEEDLFRESEYLYAEEKRWCENHLKEKYEKRTNREMQVSIVRPAAITGPRGRFMRIRFGLQAALSGMLEKSFAERLVSNLVSFVPVTPKWARQFIHEDDVAGITERIALGAPVSGYEVFNICPPGKVVRGEDMARAVGKRTLPVYPWMVRVAFFFFWHLTRGKIPTGPGAWKSYSYPIMVDGSKVTRILGYEYLYEGFNAFYYTNGIYEKEVPEQSRRTK